MKGYKISGIFIKLLMSSPLHKVKAPFIEAMVLNLVR